MSTGRLGYSTKTAVLVLAVVGLALCAACSSEPESTTSSVTLEPISDPATDSILQQGAMYATLNADWDTEFPRS